MNAKHTPGPWHYLGGRFVAAGTNPGCPFVADCMVSESIRATGTTEANAKLIAAAPELLEACKIMLVQFKRYRTGHGAAAYHAINILEEAIAKAEPQ